MDIKICTKCKRELPLSEYHRYKRGNETHYSQCRNCKAEYKRGNKKLLKSQYERRINPTADDKLKRKAWNALYYALKTNKITKPDKCDICGKVDNNIQAHHHDYTKSLEVAWCCQWCHAELDNTRRCV